MDKLKDQLSWEEFKLQSINCPKPIKKVTEFNRLIAHTKNFFLISGYGAFTDGYMLIISKEFIPSYGLIKKNQIDEIKFLIDLVKKFIYKKYNRKTVIFEHGMCACIGGLDRAHLHLMSVPKISKKIHFKKAIEKVLYNRKAGIKYIVYNNYKMENLHDINQIYENLKKNKKNDEIKIIGKLLKLKDIQNLPVLEWPLITIKHINRGGHYVFFDSGDKDCSFLTTHNFQTQFGREVVFELEKKINKEFNTNIKKIEENNPHLEVWRWQNFMFEKKILSTIKDAKKELALFKDKYIDEFKKYSFEVI